MALEINTNWHNCSIIILYFRVINIEYLIKIEMKYIHYYFIYL